MDAREVHDISLPVELVTVTELPQFNPTDFFKEVKEEKSISLKPMQDWIALTSDLMGQILYKGNFYIHIYNKKDKSRHCIQMQGNVRLS